MGEESNPNLTQSLYRITDIRVKRVSNFYQLSNIRDKLKKTFVNSNKGDLKLLREERERRESTCSF
jgi:hypothetical protein